MPSSVSHAPLSPRPRSRHGAGKMRQRQSNEPKKSKRPAKHLAPRSASSRRHSTPLLRVSLSFCGAGGHRLTHQGADHQACMLRQSSTVNNIRYPLWNESVSLPLNPGTHHTYGDLALADPRMLLTSTSYQRSERPASHHCFRKHHMEKTPPRPFHPPRALSNTDTR